MKQAVRQFVPVKKLVQATALTCMLLLSIGLVLPVAAHAVPVQPYFKATGGDVATGASFSTDTVACGAAPLVDAAGVVSWNSDTAPGYAGAGAEYAVRAMGYIQDFASAQINNGAPTSLSFANQPVGSSINLTTGYFGGLFTDAPCIDYWGNMPDTLQMGTVGSGSVSSLDGTYYSPVGITLNTSQIPNGSHITMYVEGNVAISGNITYLNTSWLNRKDVPSFRLIVHGSIFIDKSVTKLDGLYAAVPSTGVNDSANTFSAPKPGTVTTCAVGTTSYNPLADAATKPINTECGQQLVVNGSIVAQQLWLLRSFGSLAATTPAEIINYAPELWVAGTPATIVGEVDTSYQSIVGLPPQL